MDQSLLLKRLNQLEDEIGVLKTVVGKPQKVVLAQRVRSLANFMLSYWTLLSFIVAIIIILYVKTAFGVDYFENYRDISTNKKLSEFYRNLGDKMMEDLEFKAAVEAYRKALDINKNNAQATYGIAKAQVFQPLDGQKYYATGVAEAKVNYLLDQFPNDYHVSFLKAIAYEDRGDLDNAKLWVEKAIAKNPNFVGGYNYLGYIHKQMGDEQSAVESYEKALEIDDNSWVAHNNLGSHYLVHMEFDQALSQLEKAQGLSPNLITALNLAIANRYAGNYSDALYNIQWASEIADRPDMENDDLMEGGWVTQNMPIRKEDIGNTDRHVWLFDPIEKRILLKYNLSFDYALNGDYDSANKAFDEAQQLDKHKHYSEFFANEIRSLQNFVIKNKEARTWFREHLLILSNK
jgi:tetratricopeptide (TPR) repeat protein